MRYNLRKIVSRQSLKRAEKMKENFDRGMPSTSQRVFLFNYCVHCLPFLLTHACYMSLARHPSWVNSPYTFRWYVQTKFSAYLLGCILMHFGTFWSHHRSHRRVVPYAWSPHCTRLQGNSFDRLRIWLVFERRLVWISAVTPTSLTAVSRCLQSFQVVNQVKSPSIITTSFDVHWTQYSPSHWLRLWISHKQTSCVATL